MRRPARARGTAALACGLLAAGCATPQYAVRPTPVPEESASAVQIERAISTYQAREFDRLGARPVRSGERLAGIDVQALVARLVRVTERPALPYRAYLYRDADPNAAALADGRIYLSTGMADYLAGRGGRPDELAFLLGHELAHTVAQHLVKRYRMARQQQLVMALVAAGASAAANASGAPIGDLVVNVASMMQNVANSGYSQEQELEADQLGIRYVIRAGFAPAAALDLLQDFTRFDTPWPFLRTHPYMITRRQHLAQYLRDTGQLAPAAGAVQPRPASDRAARLNALRQSQQLYPRGSVSWQNLQRQIDLMER